MCVYSGACSHTCVSILLWGTVHKPLKGHAGCWFLFVCPLQTPPSGFRSIAHSMEKFRPHKDYLGVEIIKTRCVSSILKLLILDKLSFHWDTAVFFVSQVQFLQRPGAETSLYILRYQLGLHVRLTCCTLEQGFASPTELRWGSWRVYVPFPNHDRPDCLR